MFAKNRPLNARCGIKKVRISVSIEKKLKTDQCVIQKQLVLRWGITKVLNFE
jgi:hypothetical protein